jgi:CubicO group peptidase (beta-lactamase class C family)
MKNSSFYCRDIKRMQRAVPYLLKGDSHIRLPFYDVPDSGAGGLLTSVEDLSHFLIAHMNNGTYKSARILNNSTVELMHTIYCENASSGGISFSYGFGWMFFNISGKIYQGHDGDAPGFTARMVYNKENKTGIIFLFNRSRKTIEDFTLCGELIKKLFTKSEEL